MLWRVQQLIGLEEPVAYDSKFSVNGRSVISPQALRKEYEIQMPCPVSEQNSRTYTSYKVLPLRSVSEMLGDCTVMAVSLSGSVMVPAGPYTTCQELPSLPGVHTRVALCAVMVLSTA